MQYAEIFKIQISILRQKIDLILLLSEHLIKIGILVQTKSCCSMKSCTCF